MLTVSLLLCVRCRGLLEKFCTKYQIPIEVRAISYHSLSLRLRGCATPRLSEHERLMPAVRVLALQRSAMDNVMAAKDGAAIPLIEQMYQVLTNKQ